MTRFSSALVLLTLLMAAPLPAQNSTAQQGSSAADLSAARPGRDPGQAIDEEYTRKIHEYTTEPFFLSPLVDYLPASKTVPTPKAVLGDIAGAPTKLPDSKEVYAYMRLLAKSSPRVRVYSIGRTEEGREMVAVAVASEELMAKLDENKAKLAKLADPRTIGMNDDEARRIAADAAPVYYITGTIHSTESGAPTALMELAYRLAVDESPYIKNIRDHLITLITPIVEVDGRDRMVDIFNWHMKHPGATYPDLVYWGHYVRHDNNRDAMGMTLKLTQNVLNTFVDWKAQVLHDLHESVPFMYDNTIGDGPFNAWLDPLLTNEWQMIGWNNVQEMTRFGMPGVFAHGQFDTWSPGYLMFIAATHNGISRLYETFGNGGTAETLDRTLSPSETERTWYRQNPPLAHVKWSLRNNNNYEQTGILVSLSYIANNRRTFLENFYEKSKRSILKPKTEGPAAYVLPADDPRRGAQADLLRVLQKQAVEISRATRPFSVTVVVRRPAEGRGGRAGRGAATQGDSAPPRPTEVTETRQFPAGSYVIRMDQPYSRIADALLDYQYWSPNDPQKNPYDDTGWTFPEGFGVRAVRTTDTKVLDVPMERVTGEIKAPGGVTGSGGVFLVNHNGDNALATLRYKLRNADFQAAEAPFDADGKHFNRGSFVIRNVSQGDLDRLTKELGISAYASAAAPNVKLHPLRAARIALLHTWQNTQTEGWWRQALDFLQIPYDYISTQDVAKNATLNAKYDVILFPPAGGNANAIIQGLPQWRNPLPWKKTPETPNIGVLAQTEDLRPGLGWQGLANLESFVRRGGVLVSVENTADFAVQFGLANGVSVNQPRRGEVVGTLLRSRIVDDASPIVYGVKDSLALYSANGQSFGVSSVRGGRGGGRFGAGNGEARATGRGTPDDPDVVQGRPLDERFDAPRPTPVQPWQAAPVTDEILRNPVGVIPPDQRPRVAVRFADQRDLLVSGLLDGGTDIAQRPAVIDAPLEKGHVVLFANNPIYRGETIGSYFLVFNTVMNFDNLNVGRKLDSK
ncbi:MAG TPA: M14 family zinc carboxypeptidase [Gemmatimonadaceae bacterium]